MLFTSILCLTSSPTSRSRKCPVHSPPIVICWFVALIPLDQQIVGRELHRHIHLEWLAIEEDQALDVGANEPCEVGSQVIADNIAFLQRIVHSKNRVHIIVG